MNDGSGNFEFSFNWDYSGKGCFQRFKTLPTSRRNRVRGVSRLKFSAVFKETHERILNHTLKGEADRVYNRYTYLKEQREVLSTWGDILTSVVAP